MPVAISGTQGRCFRWLNERWQEPTVDHDFNKLEWINKKGDRRLVAKTTKDELKAQPNFDTKAYDTAAAQMAQPAENQAARVFHV